MTYNFNEQIKGTEKKYGVGGNQDEYFNFEKGDNRIRILTPNEPYGYHYLGKGAKSPVCYGQDKGCPHHGEDAPKVNVKWCGYVLDKKDDKIKIAMFPHTVIKAVGLLQSDEDYAFSDLPMPYDIKVTFDPDASPGDMYKILPTPQKEELSEEIKKELDKRLTEITPEQLIEKMKKKQMKADGIDPTKLQEVEQVPPQESVVEYPEDDINPEDIPF